MFEGQKAIMRFSAFNQRTTPEISGHVVQISPDLTIDQKTGVGFYLVRVAPEEKDIPKLGGIKLIPGMPIEAFVETGDRTILSYLMKPATDQISRAFRGD
jgi:HlyD family secretion protein